MVWRLVWIPPLVVVCLLLEASVILLTMGNVRFHWGLAGVEQSDDFVYSEETLVCPDEQYYDHDLHRMADDGNPLAYQY